MSYPATKISPAERDLLVMALRTVRKRAVESTLHSTQCGICYNWAEELMYFTTADEITQSRACWLTYGMVETVSHEWEHYSGTPCAPIPELDKLPTWAGANLIMRLSLIDFLLDRLEHWNFDAVICSGGH